jgi:hypothetical protein
MAASRTSGVRRRATASEMKNATTTVFTASGDLSCRKERESSHGGGDARVPLKRGQARPSPVGMGRCECQGRVSRRQENPCRVSQFTSRDLDTFSRRHSSALRPHHFVAINNTLGRSHGAHLYATRVHTLLPPSRNSVLAEVNPIRSKNCPTSRNVYSRTCPANPISLTRFNSS